MKRLEHDDLVAILKKAGYEVTKAEPGAKGVIYVKNAVKKGIINTAFSCIKRLITGGKK